MRAEPRPRPIHRLHRIRDCDRADDDGQEPTPVGVSDGRFRQSDPVAGGGSIHCLFATPYNVRGEEELRAESRPKIRGGKTRFLSKIISG